MSARDNAHPHPWIAKLAQQTRDDVASAYADTQLLAVRVEDPLGELGLSLGEVERGPGARLRPARDALGFATVVGSRADLEAAPPPPPPRRQQAPALTAADLQARLAKAPHFFVPLRKREGKPFAERISVGRALNNDVVLRHASVSKFHAYFECDDKGGFYLTDARSKNTTTVNGAVVESMARVHPGDEIAFGSVYATICPATVLWDALR